MQLLAVFILATGLAVANSQATVQPYVVPIYRVPPTTATTATTDGTTPTETTATATSTQLSTSATTTESVATTPSTTQKPTIPAALDTRADTVVIEHVCSGTLVDASAVITTVTCIESAMRETTSMPCVGTAEDTTSTNDPNKVLYLVETVIKHPDFDATTLANNIAVLKLANQVDLARSSKVKPVLWTTDVPAVDAPCVTSYWNADSPFTQVNQVVTFKACEPETASAVCSTFTDPPTTCPNGANGASLVCDNKLAGVFAARSNADCSASLWKYKEIAEDAAWIDECVNSAAIFNVSLAAILALITAMLKSL